MSSSFTREAHARHVLLGLRKWSSAVSGVETLKNSSENAPRYRKSITARPLRQHRPNCDIRAIYNSPRRAQKAPAMPGPEVAGISGKSVLPDDWSTPVEAVVDASGDEVHVLADRVRAEYAADRDDSGTQNTCRREAATMVTHEQVIVLDCN
jgi:hypothetical protein